MPGKIALIALESAAKTGQRVDQVLADKLAVTITNIAPDLCLPGHWTPLKKEIIIQDLLDGE